MSSDINTVENVIRNFVRHGVATADGAADGTTVVSLWDPTAAEGMNEPDGFWNDSWIQIIVGDMKNRRRRVTNWVQATGVLTVDPAFINPRVSLLTVNSPLGDLVIDVADASVFRVGEAFIWDTVTPAGELVTITVVDTVLNQLTIAGPGIVQILGYLIANNAAISMSRRITDGTHFRLECYTKVEDTGTHTNPRRYEKDNGIFSAPIARAGGIATALWTIATVRPRTAGRRTTIYTLIIENITGAAITGWLEIGGVAITPVYHVNNGETAVVTFVAGQTTGNNDVLCNASVNAVVFQVIGTEA